MADKDIRLRSVIKALSWRVFATTATIIIVFAFTGRLILSLGVGVVEIITKLILYYFHERLWTFIPFGRKRHALSSLTLKEPIKEQDLELIKNKLRELGYIAEEKKNGCA